MFSAKSYHWGNTPKDHPANDTGCKTEPKCRPRPRQYHHSSTNEAACKVALSTTAVVGAAFAAVKTFAHKDNALWKSIRRRFTHSSSSSSDNDSCEESDEDDKCSEPEEEECHEQQPKSCDHCECQEEPVVEWCGVTHCIGECEASRYVERAPETPPCEVECTKDDSPRCCDSPCPSVHEYETSACEEESSEDSSECDLEDFEFSKYDDTCTKENSHNNNQSDDDDSDSDQDNTEQSAKDSDSDNDQQSPRCASPVTQSPRCKSPESEEPQHQCDTDSEQHNTPKSSHSDKCSPKSSHSDKQQSPKKSPRSGTKSPKSSYSGNKKSPKSADCGKHEHKSPRKTNTHHAPSEETAFEIEAQSVIALTEEICLDGVLWPGNAANGHVKIFYLHSGFGIDQNRKTIVLIHGVPLSSETFECAMEQFVRAGYQVIAPDLRGFGRSEQPEDLSVYTFANFVTDVHELILHLQIQNPIILGDDLGGLIALQYAAQYQQKPEAASQLILQSSTAKYINDATYEDGIEMEEFEFLLVQLNSVSCLQQFVHFYNQAALDDPNVASMSEAKYAELLSFVDNICTHSRLDIVRHIYLNVILLIDLRSILHTISIPTLVVFGSADQILPARSSYYLADHLENSFVECIRKASHYLQLTYYKSLVARILSFLDERPEESSIFIQASPVSTKTN